MSHELTTRLARGAQAGVANLMQNGMVLFLNFTPSSMHNPTV